MIDITDWFDIHNIDHMKAYKHLGETGKWPEFFIPSHVVHEDGEDYIVYDVRFMPNWNIILMSKMADEYVKLKLQGYV